MENCPRWVDLFIKLVRPGALALMVGLLVFGGLLFAAIELFLPNEGTRAAAVFVGFFKAMDPDYYTTVQVMFTAYVFGKSGEAVATSVAKGKVAAAEAESKTNAEPAG